MNTRNWQIKILTLCMAAFALCLTVACGKLRLERRGLTAKRGNRGTDEGANEDTD